MKSIALSGEPGSFSEEAATIYASRIGIDDPDFIYAVDMEGVLSSLDESNLELGIFPVVNSRGGLVRSAFHAMGAHLFELVDELWMEVHQCIMVKKEVNKESVRKVVSHSQAIAQCDRYLKKEFTNAQLVEWDDTAKAAKDLASGVLSEDTAVIAPAQSARIYDLKILESGIQDQHPNLTTFIVVKKKV